MLKIIIVTMFFCIGCISVPPGGYTSPYASTTTTDTSNVYQCIAECDAQYETCLSRSHINTKKACVNEKNRCIKSCQR